MTENTPAPADHIAELYALARDIDEGESVYYGADDWRKTARDLRDASNAWESDRERLTAERDALAAVTEQVKAIVHEALSEADDSGNGWDAEVSASALDEILSTAPATVLAQRDVRVRAEAAAVVRAYWETNGELVDTNNGARLAFGAVAAEIEEAQR